MRRRFQVLAAVLLVALAAAAVFGIVSLYGWGGRIEVMLMVFGDPVWVTLDAGRPQLWVLLLIPGLLLAGARSLYARRPQA